MKLWAAALVLPASASFLGGELACRTPMLCDTSSRHAAARVQMISTKEVFSAYSETVPPVQKTMQGLPKPAAQGAMAGVVAAAAATGYAITPSSRIAVNAVGGVLAGLGGMVGRKRLANERQKAALPAIAALLAEGPGAATSEKLMQVAEDFGVSKQLFQEQLSDVFLTYLNAVLGSNKLETSELSELIRLKQQLRLTSAQVGTQVYNGCRNFYSRHRAYLEDDGDNESKQLLKKLVFLSERLLSEDESEEGYRYEVTKVQRIFSLIPSVWNQMAEDAAVPFYERALNTGVLDGKGVTSEQLAAVRSSLGISAGCAAGMHATVYAKAADGLLQPSLGPEAKLSSSSVDRLAAVEALLGMSADDSDKQLKALTMPLYSALASAVLGEAAAVEGDINTAGFAGKLAMRQEDLKLSVDESIALEREVLRAAASGLLSQSIKLLRARANERALTATQALVAYCQKMTGFMQEIQHVTGSSDEASVALFGGLRATLTADSMKASEGLSMYRLLMLRFLSEGELQEEKLATLRQILGISDTESDSVYRAAAGPMFKKAVAEAASGDLSHKAKTGLQKLLTDLALPEAVTKAMSAEVYAESLKEVAGGEDDSRIMSKDDSSKLVKLRDFLDLEMEDVYEMHASACSQAFKKSVLESMSTTGIIPEEYMEKLDELESQLVLSKETTKGIFMGVATDKLKEYAQKAFDVLGAKSKEAAKEAEGKKGDGKLGIDTGDLTAEVTKMIDFALGAKVLHKVDGFKKEVADTSLDGVFSSKNLKELYRQYLGEAFAAAGSDDKLFDNLPRLSLLLGIDEFDVADAHNDIGSRIYRQYLGKALKKGPLGAKDLQFLESIKQTLNMDENKCELLVKGSKLDRVAGMVEGLFQSPSLLAEKVREVRDMADQLEVDFVEDLKTPKFRLEKMFACELEDLIETGELTLDDPGALEELCEPLHITEEKAQGMLEAMVQKRLRGSVLQAVAQMLGDDPDGAIEETAKFIKFAQLGQTRTPEVTAVSASQKEDLFLLYQADLLTGSVMTDSAEEELALLREVLGVEGEID